MNQDAIEIEVLKTIRIFGEHELVPRIKSDLVDRDMHEGHRAIPIDCAHEETALVGAEDKVHPGISRSEKALAERGDFRGAAEHKILFAATARKEPATDGRR